MKRLEPAKNKIIRNEDCLCYNCLVKSMCNGYKSSVLCRENTDWANSNFAFPLFDYLKDINAKQIKELRYTERKYTNYIDNIIVHQGRSIIRLSADVILDDDSIIRVSYDRTIYNSIHNRNGSTLALFANVKSYLHDIVITLKL